MAVRMDLTVYVMFPDLPRYQLCVLGSEIEYQNLLIHLFIALLGTIAAKLLLFSGKPLKWKGIDIPITDSRAVCKDFPGFLFKLLGIPVPAGEVPDQ